MSGMPFAVSEIEDSELVLDYNVMQLECGFVPLIVFVAYLRDTTGI